MLKEKVKRLDNVTFLYSPRSSYYKTRESQSSLLADLTLNFDKFTIGQIRNQFIQRGNSLTLKEFILVTQKYFNSWQVDLKHRAQRLVRCLTRLFHQIDINQSGTLDWQQFTNYIIENATNLKNIKNINQEVKPYTVSTVRPSLKFDEPLCKPIWIPALERIAFFQQHSDKVYLMNVQTGRINQKVLTVHPVKVVIQTSVHKKGAQAIKKQFVIPTKTHLLDMIYIPEEKYGLLLTSTTDGFVRGWKYNQGSFSLALQPDNQEQRFQRQFSQEVYSMAWDYLNQILFCGLKQGSIFMWNLKTDTEKQLAKQQKFNREDLREIQIGHQGLVMQMISMPKLQFMASAGMDGKLLLWDTINNTKKYTYSQHTKGILTLAFNQSLILLFSGGFDHKICIWNPYIPTMIHKIQVHNSAILCIRFVPGTNQFVSLDQMGNVKILDTRRFHVINSFNVQPADKKQKFSAVAFTSVPSPLKLVFSGVSIKIFEYDKHYNPQHSDDLATTAFCFHQMSLNFYTASGNRIKLWSGLTGHLVKIFPSVITNDISCCSLDKIQRRLLIGDVSGNCAVLNSINGSRLRTLPKHAGQIIGMLHLRIDRLIGYIITAGNDNKINIVNDLFNESQNNVVRTISIGRDLLMTCINCYQASKLIVVGTNIGMLGFYQVQTGKLSGNTKQLNVFQEITSCNLIQGLPFLIATYNSGMIAMFSIPPLTFKYQFILRIHNFDEEKPETHLGVTHSVFLSNMNRLVIADQKQYIKCFCFQAVCQQFQPYRDLNKASEEKRLSKSVQISAKTISILWKVKAHAETIVSLTAFAQNKYIATSSFDKRLKIFSSEKGEFIDSLQQNYEISQAKPIAYIKSNNKGIFDLAGNRVDKNDVQTNGKQACFDPFYYFQRIASKKVVSQVSNQNWQLRLDFKHVFQQNEAKVKQILKLIKTQSKLSPIHNVVIQKLQKKYGLDSSGKLSLANFIQQQSQTLHLPYIQEMQWPSVQKDGKIKEIHEQSSSHSTKKFVQQSQEFQILTRPKRSLKNYQFQPIRKLIQKKTKNSLQLKQDAERQRKQTLWLSCNQSRSKILRQYSQHNYKKKGAEWQLATALQKINPFDTKFLRNLDRMQSEHKGKRKIV